MGFLDYTAKEVLQGIIPRAIPSPHSVLSAICMESLIAAGFQQSTLASSEEFENTLGSTPLLAYAYRSWSYHGHECLNDDAAKARLLTFVKGCQAFPVIPFKYGPLDFFGSRQVAEHFGLPLGR
jgi:ankyrin repeat domain-containing protein 50